MNTRIVAAGIAITLLSACAARPEAGFLLPSSNVTPGAVSKGILVATTRLRDAAPGTLFSGERAAKLDFADIVVSTPPNHVMGQIEWPSSPPGDSATNFVVRHGEYLDDEKTFVRNLNARLAASRPGHRGVVVFVHGYNTLFAEGLYRFAQVLRDSQNDDVPVLFSWASHGRVSDYVYDMNSATAARDDLERTLRLIFSSNAERVNILAHSLGNWVTIEAMRQIKISDSPVPMRKLGVVALASPDVDMDVFKSQMRRFGKPAKPFFIVLSRDDRALAASRFIASGFSNEGPDRVGSSGDIAELNKLGAIVIDLTKVDSSDSSNHGKFADLAQAGPRLKEALEKGVAANPRTNSQDQKAHGAALDTLVTIPRTLLGGQVFR